MKFNYVVTISLEKQCTNFCYCFRRPVHHTVLIFPTKKIIKIIYIQYLQGTHIIGFAINAPILVAFVCALCAGKIHCNNFIVVIITYANPGRKRNRNKYIRISYRLKLIYKGTDLITVSVIHYYSRIIFFCFSNSMELFNMY